MTRLDVYGDGSATIATKPGGYGWVLVIDGVKHSEGNGYLEKATNNDAELESLIYGLTAAYKLLHKSNYPKDEVHVTVYSDSQIALGWANGKYRYKKNGNTERYKLLLELIRRMNVKTQWVRGHDGNEFNERCDKLANEARKGLPKSEPKPKKEKVKNTIGKKKDNVFNIWFGNVLKIIDLQNNICEDYNEKVHGPRNSRMEYRNK